MAGGTLLLSGLWPPFAEAVSQFLQAADYYGIEVTLVSGYRSMEEQRQLYAKGRTPQQIAQHVRLRGAHGSVTDAPPGSSPHNYGLAIDIESPNLGEARALAQWMGFGTVSWDLPHIEWPSWSTLVR